MSLSAPLPTRTEHPFLTYDMIHEVPAALEATLLHTQQEARGIAEETSELPTWTFTGAGTAYFAAVLGSQLLHLAPSPPTHRVLEAFELLHYPPDPSAPSMVTAVSHSGVTKVTLDATRRAREAASFAVGISHFPKPPLRDVVDRLLVVGNGPDRSKCHTKSYLSGALATATLALERLRLDGELPDPLREVAAQIAQLPAWSTEVLRKCDDACAGWARTHGDWDHCYIVGGGPNRVTTQEAALKLKETSYVPAEGLEMEELGHGPWVSLGPQSLVLLLAPRGPSHPRALELARAAKHVGASVLALITAGDEALPPIVDGVIELPPVNEWLSPFLYILPLYLFAYYTSVNRGGNPDELRYLEPPYWEARQIVFPPGTH